METKLLITLDIASISQSFEVLVPELVFVLCVLASVCMRRESGDNFSRRAHTPFVRDGRRRLHGLYRRTRRQAFDPSFRLGPRGARARPRRRLFGTGDCEKIRERNMDAAVGRK